MNEEARERKGTPSSRRLCAIEPWAASGPGWANAGITLLWEEVDHPQVIHRKTIYREDLRGDAAVLFPHLLALYNAVKIECERGRAGRPRW
ncbi:MAG: hypothetical protein KatS3mg015_2832 [Fimbriimonadales bacterium]|nr:MAG: hypothetical protein KatS3mg015_2832 [Fimbriimonadales bacterium]